MRKFSLLLVLVLLVSMIPLYAMAEDAPVKITMFAMTDADEGTWKDMDLFRYIEERFNVEFDITEISRNVWTEKIAIAFATDDYPDFIPRGLTTTDIQTYGAQGMILDLSEYINDEKTPNISATLNKYPNFRAALQSWDGHIYSLAGYDRNHLREYLQARFFVNTKWAENLGVKIPTTLDEFYDYMVAIKENDANQNGDPNDEIPMAGAYDSDPFSLLNIPLTAYGYALAYGRDNNYVDVKDGEVIFVPTEEHFKDALTFMKRCYDEGLLDGEYFTQSAEQVDAKLSEGVAGCFMDWAQWLSIPDKAMYDEYTGITPLTSEFNSTPIWPAFSVLMNGAAVVTDKCSDEVLGKLLEILDWCYTYEAAAMVLGGHELGTVEGLDYGYTPVLIKEDDEGIPYICLDFTFDQEKYSTTTAWREDIVSPGWDVLPVARLTWEQVESAESEISLSNALEAYIPYATVGWPNSIKFSAEEYDELSLLTTDIESYLDQMVAKFITGEESLDNFSTFVEGCNARGLERYMEIYRAAYARYLEVINQ